jgi:hypothetical protein
LSDRFFSTKRRAAQNRELIFTWCLPNIFFFEITFSQTFSSFKKVNVVFRSKEVEVNAQNVLRFPTLYDTNILLFKSSLRGTL